MKVQSRSAPHGGSASVCSVVGTAVRPHTPTLRPHTPTLRPLTAEREIVTGDNSPVAIGGSITQTINNPPRKRKAKG